MKAYRIESRTAGCDCCGRTEWDFWRTYDNKVYSTEAKAKEAIKVLPTNHGDTQYRVAEVELVMDNDD